MRCKLILSMLALVPFLAHAQVIGDCEGAIVLCGDLYTEDQAPLTFGDTYEWTGGCNASVEQNSVWYTFTVQTPGELSFTLTPNNLNDDYDWGLFNITDGGCAGVTLQDGSSPEVSCNSWGTFGVNGATGISTDQGGSGNSNGPGNLNGPPFNGDLPVTVGETFALVVMNWSNSQFGYSIDFGESTASLYDDVSPVLESITTDCANQTFTLTFSEPIVILSVDLLDFTLTGPGGTFTAVNVDSQTENASYDSVLVVSFNEQISVPGTYTLNIQDEGGYVEDPCGNLAINTLDVLINDPVIVDIVTTDACNGVNGGFEITNIDGGQSPFVIYLENVIQNGQDFQNLNAGLYDVLIVDDLECEVALTVEVPDHQLSLNIPPQDGINCSNGITIQGITVEPDQDVDIEWTFEPGNGNIVNGANTLSPMIDQPGTYTITVTDPLDGCSYSAEVEIEQGLLDNTPPTITAVQAECGSNSILLTFSEPVETATVESGDFSIDSGNVNLPINDVEPALGQNNFESVYLITLDGSISESGLYTIDLTSTSDFILDQCGNEAIGDFDVELFALITYDVEATVACNGTDGTIEVSNIEGGGEPFTFLLNGQPQNDLSLDDVNDGGYTIVIQDEHGCVTEQEIEVPAHFISVTVPLQDSLTCEIPVMSIEGLAVSPDQEVSYQWNVSGNDGLITSGAQTASPDVAEPGIYAVTVTDPETGCSASAVVEVPAGQVYGVDLSSLTFPNVVTVNSDGKNDYWAPYLALNPSYDLGVIFDTYELTIYNRWGNKIYESSGGRTEWEVSDVMEGTYFYTVKYAANCGDSVNEQREGIITILR